MPDDVIEGTKQKYEEAFRMLTGKTLQETMDSLSR